MRSPPHSAGPTHATMTPTLCGVRARRKGKTDCDVRGKGGAVGCTQKSDRTRNPARQKNQTPQFMRSAPSWVRPVRGNTAKARTTHSDTLHLARWGGKGSRGLCLHAKARPHTQSCTSEKSSTSIHEVCIELGAAGPQEHSKGAHGARLHTHNGTKTRPPRLGESEADKPTTAHAAAADRLRRPQGCRAAIRSAKRRSGAVRNAAN